MYLTKFICKSIYNEDKHLSDNSCRYFQEHWYDGWSFFPEVYFPKELVTCYPWGECKPESKDQLQKLYKISHITRKSNMATIKAGDHCYHFEPKQKYGKCGYEVTDSSPLGESYRCVLNRKTPTTETQYTKVIDKELLLPDGYYVWWGPSNVTRAPCMRLRNSPQISSQHLVNLYGFIKIQMNQILYLCVGGTLRYKKEIAMSL